jgi:Domain of unknown function (DUF4145)
MSEHPSSKTPTAPGRSPTTFLDIAAQLEGVLTRMPGKTLICDHCGVSFVGRLKRLEMADGTRDPYEVLAIRCASCRQHLIYLAEWKDPAHVLPTQAKSIVRLWPQAAYVPVSKEVPEEIARDFREANLVLSASPKASAAMSRRLLQRILHEKVGIRGKNLAHEIEEFLKTKPPSYVAKSLDAIRAVGNFAAHPLKSTRTGEIIEVEPGEAEWLLETLVSLFDHLFVQPARAAAQLALLKQKLDEAGKQPRGQQETKPVR